MGDASLMDDLAAAWDATEGPESDTDEIQEAGHEEAADGSGSGEAGAGASVSEALADAEGVDDAGDGGGDEAGGAEQPAGSEPAAEGQDEDLSVAPRGLSPQAREEWANTPESVRREYAKRERDYENGIKQYAQHARRAQAMDSVLQPYNQLLAMNGGPQNILPGLLQTASILQMGSPQQKAQQTAALIKQFGIDIKTLDGFLVGDTPKVSEEDRIQQAIDQRLQPVLQHYQQQEQARRQEQDTQLTNELQQFAQSHEFYNDVAADMADLLDMAAQRNTPMSLDEAYNKACAMNPQISQVIKNRELAGQTQNRRRAASSVRGAPGGDGAQAPGNSVRDLLEHAWQNTGRV